MVEREPTFTLHNVEVAIGILEDEGYPLLSAAVKRCYDALAMIATQKLPEELVTTDERMDADYEGGFSECIRRAREGLGPQR